MLRQALAIFRKDLESELRTRYAVNALLMFVVVTISVIVFSLAGEVLTIGAMTGMLWVVMFFAAMSGLSRVFVAEEERGTAMTLQLLASPMAVYLGKLLFNIVLVLGLNALIVVLFLLTMEQFTIRQADMFAVVMLFGGLGIATSTTIIAAIIARANTKGTLFPVLAFPVLLPLLMAGISGTNIAVEGGTWNSVWPDLQLLGSYIVVVTTVSFMLFDFVWKD